MAPLTKTQMTFKIWAVVATLVSSIAAHAQDTQFLPEIDPNLKIGPSVRLYVQAKDDREGGSSQQFTFGPSIQFYFKPLLKLKDVTRFDLDDEKKRPVVLESGYRLITAPNTPVQISSLSAVTFHSTLM